MAISIIEANTRQMGSELEKMEQQNGNKVKVIPSEQSKGDGFLIYASRNIRILHQNPQLTMFKVYHGKNPLFYIVFHDAMFNTPIQKKAQQWNFVDLVKNSIEQKINFIIYYDANLKYTKWPKYIKKALETLNITEVPDSNEFIITNINKPKYQVNTLNKITNRQSEHNPIQVNIVQEELNELPIYRINYLAMQYEIEEMINYKKNKIYIPKIKWKMSKPSHHTKLIVRMNPIKIPPSLKKEYQQIIKKYIVEMNKKATLATKEGTKVIKEILYYKSKIKMINVTEEETNNREINVKELRKYLKELYGEQWNNTIITNREKMSEREVDEAIKTMKKSQRVPSYDGYSAKQFINITREQLNHITMFLNSDAMWRDETGINKLRLTILDKRKKEMDKNVDLEQSRMIMISSFWIALYEEIILKKLEQHGINDTQLTKYQMGFRKKCSTELQYIRELEIIKRRNIKTIALIDLRKAYDSILRETLLNTLKIPQTLVNTLKNLYQNLTLYAHTPNKKIFRLINPVKGLYQGSKLAPILFNHYINNTLIEINHIPKTITLAYVDDLITNIEEGKTQEKIKKLIQIKTKLRLINMQTSEKKSVIIPITKQNQEISNIIKWKNKKNEIYLGFELSKKKKYTNKKADMRNLERITNIKLKVMLIQSLFMSKIRYEWTIMLIKNDKYKETIKEIYKAWRKIIKYTMGLPYHTPTIYINEMFYFITPKRMIKNGLIRIEKMFINIITTGKGIDEDWIILDKISNIKEKLGIHGKEEKQFPTERQYKLIEEISRILKEEFKYDRNTGQIRYWYGRTSEERKAIRTYILASFKNNKNLT